MLGGVNSTATTLSALYNSQAQELSATQTRIATGKKINSPADDFAGYIKAQGYDNDIAGYKTLKINLADAKGMTSAAVTAGNTVASTLTQMGSLRTAYNATSDTFLRRSGFN